jgi:hypothetical protein
LGYITPSKNKRVSDGGEKTITSWGRAVGTQHRSLLFPQTDLRIAEGCVKLLKEMLEAVLKKIAGVDAVARDKEYRDGKEENLALVSRYPNICTQWEHRSGSSDIDFKHMYSLVRRGFEGCR